MKTIKTLLKENNLKDKTDYFDLILKQYYKGNHLKAANLFQDLKKIDKEFFLCNYIGTEPFIKVSKFFIKELISI